MPNYDYRCETCGHQFETWQKITEAPLVACPVEKCPGPVARVISGAGFILKGSGWYATDYKSAKPAAAPSPSTPSAPAPSSTDSKA